MAISLASLTSGTALDPPRLIIYGPAGIGKTTLAAGAPDPVLLRTEDGLGMLGVPTFPLLRSFGEVMEALTALYQETHDRKTLLLDSLDWLEPLIWREACDRHGWASIEDPGYGKGYEAALDVWREFAAIATDLRNDRRMGTIFLAHARVMRFEGPETEPYDRYSPKLHESRAGKGANPLLQENVDCVLYYGYRVSVLRDQGKGDKKGEGHARGVGGGQRLIHTQERPAYLAKNRYGMPPSIPMPDSQDPAVVWAELARFIPYYNTAT